VERRRGTDQLRRQRGGHDAATYDGNGVRASATTASGTQNFTWDNAGDLLMDSVNAYIYTNGSAPAEQVNLSTGSVTYLDTDSLGSVRGIISSAGALTATTAYDAWGNPQTTGGLTSHTPFGYAGAYTDPDGLLYLINRYYNPATGQFLSVDPDVAATGQPYAYAGGDPVDNTDPAGLFMAANTGADVRVGSPQYLETIVPRINYNNPLWTQIPRTPAQKKTAPAKRKVVRKAAKKPANKTLCQVDPTGPLCTPKQMHVNDGSEQKRGNNKFDQDVVCPDLGELAICPNLATTGSEDDPSDKGSNGGGSDDLSDLLGAAQGNLASDSNLANITQHLDNIGALDHPPNAAMLERLQEAISSGRPLTPGETNFMIHELTESSLMDRGVEQDMAHQMAGEMHRTFANYDPEVIKQYPEWFNSNWRAYWNIP
jgi:RHS repeat-associated protein